MYLHRTSPIQTWQLHDTMKNLMMAVAMFPSGSVFVERCGQDSSIERFHSLEDMISHYSAIYGDSLHLAPFRLRTFELRAGEETESKAPVMGVGVTMISETVIVEWIVAPHSQSFFSTFDSMIETKAHQQHTMHTVMHKEAHATK